MPGSSPRAGTVVTRQADHAILRGITRTVLLDVLKAQGLTLEERAFTLEEAYAAREAFVTSASQIVLPVVRIDDHVIGDGKPGPLASRFAAGVSSLCRGRLGGRRDFPRTPIRNALPGQPIQEACQWVLPNSLIPKSLNPNLGLHRQPSRFLMVGPSGPSGQILRDAA